MTNIINLDKEVSTIIENDSSGKNYEFHSNWTLWFHREKNNWKIGGYAEVFTIKNIKHFWNFHNNIHKIGGVTAHHFFLMRNDIEPTWEHEKNRTGGTWSFKVPAEDTYKLWERLALYIVGETLVDKPLKINGLSVRLKNPSISIIKIWTSDASYNSLKLLPKPILDDYGYNIIFKANIPEYN
jgi:hypothetical protein